MSDLIIILLIIVVTILFVLIVYAPPRREHVPEAPRIEAHTGPRGGRQVRRRSPLEPLEGFWSALFGQEFQDTFEGERILHRTRRHWAVLLRRGFVLLLLAFGMAALVLFRWNGGTFIVGEVRQAGEIGPVEVILLILVVAVIYFWQRSAKIRAKDKKKKPSMLPDLPYVFALGLLGMMLYFRWNGGEILYFDPFAAHQNDTINQFLLLGCLLSFLALFYIAIDWSNDFLILTPTRVISEDTQLLVRQIQQELVIENVQQVNVRADSYFAYVLGYVRRWMQVLANRIGLRRDSPEPISAVYAKIIIGSFSPQTLSFEWASRPYDFQKALQGEVGKLRRQQDVDTLRRLIENQVYENKPPKSATPQIEVQTKEVEGLLGWFRHPNPEVSRDGDFYALTWRPVKLFMLQAISRPYFTFLLPTLALWFLARVGLLLPEWGLLIGFMIALVMLGWGIWIREEHENDKFILNIREIVDVDKKPFGPESSRRAPLSAIQNIEFDVSLVEGMLGYGDVIITTAGGAGKFTFEHVPDPRGVQATINNYLSYFKRRDTERTLKSTLDLLQQYHYLQGQHNELFDDGRVRTAIDSQVAELLERELPPLVEREVAEKVPQEINRQVVGPLRRELGRSGIFRRRRLR